MASPSVYELSASNGSNSVLTAAKGTYILNDTSLFNAEKVRAIVVLEDTVFNSIKHFGSALEVKTDYIAASGTAVKAGAIITPFNQQLFGAIELTSGSVALVL